MAGLGKKQGVCIDIPLRRVEAFSEVVSEQVVERIGPVYKLMLLLGLSYIARWHLPWLLVLRILLVVSSRLLSRRSPYERTLAWLPADGTQDLLAC